MARQTPCSEDARQQPYLLVILCYFSRLRLVCRECLSCSAGLRASRMFLQALSLARQKGWARAPICFQDSCLALFSSAPRRDKAGGILCAQAGQARLLFIPRPAAQPGIGQDTASQERRDSASMRPATVAAITTTAANINHQHQQTMGGPILKGIAIAH